jgi:hypothetical protein
MRGDRDPFEVRYERPRLQDHHALLAIAIGGALLEAALLSAFGQHESTALAPQGTAPPPFGVFHDLRWLLVFHQSWWSFAVEALAFVVVRTGLVTALVASAWPRDVARPPTRTLVRAAAVFVVVASVLLVPSVALLFGMAVVPVSWGFFVAVPTALFVGLVVHHAVVGNGGWRSTPTLRSAGWVLLSFVVLSAAGAAITAAPNVGVQLLAAAATGLFNAWAWLGIVHTLVCRREPVPVPLAPIGITVVAALVVGGAAIGFGSVSGSWQLRHDVRASLPAGGRPVLFVTGFASQWDGSRSDYLPGSFSEWRYSYRGMTVDGFPEPYHAADTDRPLTDLVATMDRQVDALAHRSSDRVAIVAESEGALVAKAYMLTHPGAPVSDLVLLSPLVEPARVYYPAAGHEGWGIAGGKTLVAAAAGIRWLSPLELSPDGPLLRSIVERPALRKAIACPAPHVHEQALFPLADAVATPRSGDLDLPIEVLPSFHGGMLGDVSAERAIVLTLKHQALPHRAALHVAERAIGYAASAWQVPQLPVGLNTAWRSGPDDCAAVRASLTASLR